MWFLRGVEISAPGGGAGVVVVVGGLWLVGGLGRIVGGGEEGGRGVVYSVSGGANRTSAVGETTGRSNDEGDRS